MPSLMNLLKRLAETHDEAFRAPVSTAGGTPTTTFYVEDLAGYGDDYFNDEWWVQVTQAGGATPEGQWRNISDYASDTGLFTVSAVFGAAIGVGDELLFIHEYQYALGARDDTAPGMDVAPADIDSVIMHVKALRETVGQEPADNDDSLHTIIGQRDGAIPAMNAAVSDTSTLVQQAKAILERVGKTPADADDSLHTSLGQRDTAATADDLSDIATTTAQSKLRRLLLRFSSNAFSATIQGSAQTDVETMFGELATYFSATGAAWGVQQNNQTSRTNLEQVWEDYLTVVGVDGTNILTNINNAAAATFNAQNQAFAKLWGADVANVFDPTIQGATKLNLNLALEALADYNAASGAAISVQMNNQTARTNFELVWEDLITLIGVPTTTQLTNINGSANVTFDAVWQQFATLWAADGANVFNPTIQGSARTDLETALNNLATYFSAAAAAMSIQVNNQTARTNLEQALEDYFTVIGCDGTNVFNPTIDGTARTTLDTALQALWDGIQNGGVKNTMINRDMPYLTEFWETEALNAAKWEETLDGLGTGAFGTADGYMYYDLDTGAIGDNDAFINSKYRWQVRPGTFSDTNTSVEALVLEFEVQLVTAVASHDATNFFLGFTSAKTNDITQDNLVGFYLDGTNLKGKTDSATTEGTTGVIAAGDTDWHKYKIRITADSVVFTFDESDEAALTADLPDTAMYIVLGTRAVGAAAVGLNIANVRAWYEEVV